MQSVRIEDLLSPARIDLDASISSKKRLLEHMASMLARGNAIDEQSAFRVLVERERLGSTGVGHGVALPHGRMKDLDDAVLALAVLNQALDYQAPDNEHVRIVVGLLVPEAASDTHLQILARLAELLNEPRLRDRLLQAKDKQAVLSAIKATESGSC